MKFKDSFLESALLNLIASSCNKFFIFFVSFFCAYVLTSEEHGALSVFIFLVSVISGIMTQSITVSSNRILSVSNGVLDEKSLSGCMNLVVLSLLIWLCMCAATLYDIDASIQFLTAGTANSAEVYILLSMVPLNIAIGVIAGVLQGQQAFKLLAIANIIPVVLLTPLSMYLITKDGIFGAIQGLLIHSITTALIHALMFIKKNKAINYVSLKLEGGEVTRKVFIPLLVTSMFVTPAYWYSTKLLSETPNGLAQASLFALVWQFGMILTQVIISLGGVIMPKLSQTNISYERNPLNYLPTMLAAFVFIVPIVLSLRFWGEYVLDDFAPDDYMQCALMISAALYISAFKSGIARVIALKGKGWISIVSNAFWLVSFLTFLKLTPVLSAVSLSKSILLAHITSLVLFLPVFYWHSLVSFSVMFSKSILLITVCFMFSMIVAKYSNSMVLNFSVLSVLFLVVMIPFFKEKKLI